MEPLPAGSPRRRDMPLSLLSPSSGSVFPATADGEPDAAVSEHPCVTLLEWWLATVDGDDQKIAVAGTFERNQTVQELSPAPIAKRHGPFVLETEDGIVLLISGSLNISRTLGHGYSIKVCENFLVGFPCWWQSCNLRYPKPTSSCTGDGPCSYTSNSGVDSTRFYLEKFQQGNHLHSCGTALISKLQDIFKSSSHNDASFQKSSHLSNGAPRFEEYTCDGDIATNENAAVSNDVIERHEIASGDQRTPVVSLEVRGFHKETQHVVLAEKAAVDEEILTSVDLDVQNSFYPSNGAPILEEYTCDGDVPTNEDTAALNDDNTRHTTPSKGVNNVEIGLVTGSTSRESGHDDIATNVSLAPTVECTNNAVSEVVDTTPTTDCKKTPVASLKSQNCSGKSQHIATNKKPVGRPKKGRSAHEKGQSATRSPLIGSPVSYAHWSPFTRGKATSLSMSTPEALKLKKTRSGRVIVPTLDAGCQRIVYGMDGSISGVIGLDSPAMPKGSESKTDGRKKRRTE